MSDIGVELPETEISIENMSAQEKELHWYKTVYRGETVPQLTVRAVVMGALLGGFMSLSNLYIGLKTGWGLGVAITACILSFAIHKTLMAVFPRLFKTDMSILENNCMQSTASSAGYSTGGTMCSAIAAYLLVTGHHIPWGVLAGWTFFLAALGVFIAIPMKRQMINVEQLRFPSGVAAAETLKSLHSKGGEAVQKARSLGIAGVLGALITWFRDAPKALFGLINIPNIPASLPIPGSVAGIPLDKLTINVEMSTIMLAAGAIMGWKIAWSLVLGGVVNYAVLAPWMVQLGAIDAAKVGYRSIVGWSTWTGASIMVTSGLFLFALQWKTVARAVSGMGAIFSKKPRTEESDKLAAIEVPSSWFLIGTVLAGMGCIYMMHTFFGTTPVMGVIAVLLTFVLSLVACRATGESDITPVGAMGKITQLSYGILAPTNITTNLMTAGLTAGAAGSSADLLTDLKSGYLLGANPRKQFLAQFIGVFAGVLVVVPAFYILVPDASVLGTDKWPAPSAQVWAAVAKLLSTGFEALHPTARMGMLLGGLLGIALPALEMLLPKNFRKFIPSATGIGLAMVIPFSNSLAMFIGAAVALYLEKKRPVTAEKYIIPVSSGLIAGESLMGVVVALLTASGLM